VLTIFLILAKSHAISTEPTIVLEPQDRATYFNDKDDNGNFEQSTEKKSEYSLDLLDLLLMGFFGFAQSNLKLFWIG
jgi:hypothetical protein